MRIFPWRTPSRKTAEEEPLPPMDDSDREVDVDDWLAMAAGPEMPGTFQHHVHDDGPDGGIDIEPLRNRLLAVLADEEASLVPPSAGDMSQQEWEALPEQQRECYRRLQLRRIDPRLVPNATLNARRSSRAVRST